MKVLFKSVFISCIRKCIYSGCIHHAVPTEAHPISLTCSYCKMSELHTVTALLLLMLIFSHSLIRHTVVSIQFSDHVSLLCVFHSPTPTMPLRRSRVQSCQPFQTSSSLIGRIPSVGTRWAGVHVCVCLRHLVKVGGSISSNHIVFAMTANVLVILSTHTPCITFPPLLSIVPLSGVEVRRGLNLHPPERNDGE